MLDASELYSLWSTLHEERRLAFVASLTQEAADQLFAYQLREHERQLVMQQTGQRDQLFDGTNDPTLVNRREGNR
jgi:hypothetical protein